MDLEIQRNIPMINDRKDKPVYGYHLHLIDALAQQLDCFVSDLRTFEYLIEVKRAVKRIPVDAYPLADWAEFYTYMTGSNCTEHDISLIKAEILACRSFHMR